MLEEIIIIIIVVFIRIIITNCYCSLRLSAKINQVWQFSDSRHAIQNHPGKSNMGFQIGNRTSCTRSACVCNHLLRLHYVCNHLFRLLWVCNHLLRLHCVCNHLLAANFHSSRSLKHWSPMAMTTHRGKLNMNVEKWGHCHIFGEEIIPTCRFLLHPLLDRLKNYSERSLGQRMNKTAKYISVRQSGRNAIITLGLGENRKRDLRLETFLLAILYKGCIEVSRLFWRWPIQDCWRKMALTRMRLLLCTWCSGVYCTNMGLISKLNTLKESIQAVELNGQIEYYDVLASLHLLQHRSHFHSKPSWTKRSNQNWWKSGYSTIALGREE